MRLKLAIFLLAAPVALPAPALANSAADYFRGRQQAENIPSLLSQDERRHYRALFDAIEANDWARAQALLAEKPDGLLTPVARAEYFLAASSPRAEGADLAALLNNATDLPQAEQLARLAQTRGASSLPSLPVAQRTIWREGVSRRTRPAFTQDGTMPGRTADAIQNFIKNDDPASARAALEGVEAGLSGAAKAEWFQRVGWSYYIENDDASALQMALHAVQNGSGAWVAEGWWTVGLAAFRLGDHPTAADAFERTAALADNPELVSAGHYWASRSWLRARQPQKVQPALLAASQLHETLYGMLARESLSMRQQNMTAADFSNADWQRLRETRNVRVSVALAEIGETTLAEDVLRHQARIGNSADFAALSRLARDLSLPGTQFWMAHNAPAGAEADPSARYPSPRWQPISGWRVDPALAYAHSLQESNFRTNVTSHAGARGLMQIMPGTARMMAQSGALSGQDGNLHRPEVNLEFGQTYLEKLRDEPGTSGLLPKVMAAYNAGPTPIARWNSEIRDQGDPLLWIESIPYWETRGYVNIVMRNYWMYERQANAGSPSRTALAQGMWPRFPGQGDSNPVRIASRGD